MSGETAPQHEQDTAPRPNPAALKPPRSRRSRWLRRSAFVMLMFCLLVTLTLWMVTRSWFIIWQLKPVLERKLGGDITIARATYHGGGRVTFIDVTLIAPDVRGPAAEIARIGQADVHVDLAALLSGKVQLSAASLAHITVRLSEDKAQMGRMNFMSLRPKSGGGKTTPPSRVRITDLNLEVGTHSGETFTLSGQRRMSGEMHPVPDAEHWFAYELAEVDANSKALGDEGLFIKGEWNSQTTEVHNRIEAITLDDRLLMMLPQQAKLWWNLMDLEGRVDGVMIDWNPQQPLAVRFSVKNIAMTMPVDLGDVWAVYRNGNVEETKNRPRMYVHSGVIRVGTDSLMLDELRGELVSAPPATDAATAPSGPATQPIREMVGVPYEISLSVPRLPVIDWNDPERWMEDALTTSAFELTARLDNFSLAKTEEGQAQAVGLPSIVARVLSKFQTTNWVLSTTVTVKRSDAAPDETGARKPSPLQVTGQAYINDATGSYHKFPYKMEDVDAYLQFTNERVDVEYLQARGSDGSTFRVTGYIEPPDKESKFHLEVTGLNVPLDDRFRDALKEKELVAFDSVFNRPSADRMAKGGVLPDQSMLDAQAAKRDALAQELAQLRRGENADANAVARLQQDIAALERSIKAGPFVCGGIGDIRLTLDRALGPAQPTEIRGVIDVKNAGLIFDRFPYPLRGSGRLLWEPDRVVIDTSNDGVGIQFATPAGGVGTVKGTIGFARTETGRKIQPDLSFTIDDDPANPTVYAAIPCGKAELEREPELAEQWPGVTLSKSGRIVQGIGLGGAFDYRGRIFTREDGKFDWDFTVALDGGTATPNTLLAQAINARNNPWPHGLTLVDLVGGVRIQRSGVSWTSVTGHSGDTLVTANGVIDFRSIEIGGGADTVSVKLDNAPIDRTALNMISAANAKTAEDLWDRFRPEGRMDGEVVWQSDAPPGESGLLTLRPRDVSVLLGNERTMLHGLQGQVRIDGREVRFEKLMMDMTCLAAPRSGVIDLDGAWAFSGDNPHLAINGRWTGGRLESPLIPQALRMFGVAGQAERYESFKPFGAIDMSYAINRGAPGKPMDYRFEINPKALEFTLRDTRVHLDIAAGKVAITPGDIALEDVSGIAASGKFQVRGGVTTQGPLDANLFINYDGLLRSDEVMAFLPEAVNDALAALEFQDGPEGGRIDNGSLHVRQSAAGDASNEENWQVDFTGRILAKGASFVGGLKFSQVDGSLDLDVSHESGRPLRLTAIGRASHAIVLGQTLHDVEAPLTLNEAGDAIEIPSAQARSGDGAVSATATSGIGQRRDYSVRIDLVGVPLLSVIGPEAKADNAGVSAPGSASPPAPADPQRKPVTGQLYASVSLSGERGDADSKRGRGVVRVLNGHLSSIPLVLQALQVMQLTLPVTSELDYADADLYVVGDTATFERILFESSVGKAAALQLRGEGTLDLNSMEIIARFRPRSGIAILRDIVGVVGDVLYEIELTGPLSDPKARIVPLP